MPDEPTTSAGAAEGSSATFSGPVERVDETTSGVPPIPPRQPVVRPTPAHLGTDAPSGAGPGSGAGSAEGTGWGGGTGSSTGTGSGTGPGSGIAADPATARTAAVGEPSPRQEADVRTEPSRSAEGRPRRPRARKVHRIIRHIDPWSALKLSLLFYAALFLIVCVASALLWGVARSSGTVDNVESFITSVGGFGNCEPVDGATPTAATTVPTGVAPAATVDQIDPGGPTSSVTEPDTAEVAPGDDEDCRPGEELVGEFRFEDSRIFQAFALGGIVLVLAGSAANVVLVLLFNLMSDLTGGVRVTVLEEDSSHRSGSPAARRRG